MPAILHLVPAPESIAVVFDKPQLVFFAEAPDGGKVEGVSKRVRQHDSLCALVDTCCHLFIIHLKRILLRVNESDRGANMAYHTGCCRIGVGCCDHFISTAYAKNLKDRFQAGCSRIEAHGLFCAAGLGNLFFKQLGACPCCYPTGEKGCSYFLGFLHGDIWWRKWNSHNIYLFDFAEYFSLMNRLKTPIM